MEKHIGFFSFNKGRILRPFVSEGDGTLGRLGDQSRIFGAKEGYITWHIESVIALFPKRSFELIVGFYM